MSRTASVVAVEHLGDFLLRLTFSDGLVRELDFDGVLAGEVFEPSQNSRRLLVSSAGTVSTDGFLPSNTSA